MLSILAWRDSLTGLEYLRRANVLAERGLTLELHAYQSHVFINWHELRPSVDQPWDRLCDKLNGRGVTSLDDALVLMELEPVHASLRTLLDPDLVRQIADFAEQPPMTVSAERKSNRERNEFFETVWARFEAFYLAAQQAPRSLTGDLNMDELATEHLKPGFLDCLRGIIQIPASEALFVKPWPEAARHILPSSSPRDSATTLWGPVFAWCALDCMASSIRPADPHHAALQLFDRLRLREPMAQAFSALGSEPEASWRGAARVKAVFLSRGMREQSKTKGPQVTSEEKTIIFAADLWADPDIRWLTGVHESDGRNYLVREPFEELLWWLQLPELLTIARQPAPDRSAPTALVKAIDDAIGAVEASGYQPDKMIAFDRRRRKNAPGTKATSAKPTSHQAEVLTDATNLPSDGRMPKQQPDEAAKLPAEEPFEPARSKRE